MLSEMVFGSLKQIEEERGGLLEWSSVVLSRC